MACKCRCCKCQQRFVISFMCLAGVLVAYAQRVCLSITITRMVEAEVRVNKNECDFSNPNETLGDWGKVRDWSQNEQQLILMSFYFGYLAMHIPAGIICDKFGAKKMYVIGMMFSTLFTFITAPVAAYMPHYAGLLVCRIIVGLGQGGLFPALSVFMTRWVPSQERGFLGGYLMGSSALGIALGSYISEELVQITKNWQMAFYFWGFIGVLWVYGANALLHNDKDSHPYISPEEKEYLDANIEQPSKAKTPWRSILTDRAIIALICGTAATDLWIFLALTNIPFYFDSVLQMEMSTSNVTWLFFAFIWISGIITGILVDCTVKKHEKVVWNRRFTSLIGAFFPLAFTIAMGYCKCDVTMVIIMYALAHYSKGPYYCSVRVNHLDLTYNFAGTVMALVNGLGCLTGVVGPLVIMEIVTSNTLKGWLNMFWMFSAISLFLHMIFVFHCSADRAEWDTPQK